MVKSLKIKRPKNYFLQPTIFFALELHMNFMISITHGLLSVKIEFVVVNANNYSSMVVANLVSQIIYQENNTD
jgi:hypothetical protein